MDTDHAASMRELAGRFFAAVTRGNIGAVRAIYAPDAVVWHAHTGAGQSVEDNLRTLAMVAKYVKDFRYEDRRCQATETGFIEQHTTKGIASDGTPFEIPACIVCTVVDGRIARLDEYFDSAAAASLLRR